MPEQSNPLLQRGRLLIHFSVRFPPPNSLTPASVAAIATLLPPTPGAAPSPPTTAGGVVGTLSAVLVNQVFVCVCMSVVCCVLYHLCGMWLMFGHF